MRVKAPGHAFSVTTSVVVDGTSHTWGCVATSDNPLWTAALYRTDLVTGSVNVPAAVPTPEGESVIMTSIFTAFVMLLAAFYY